MLAQLATSSIVTRLAASSRSLAPDAYPRIISPPSAFGWTPTFQVIEVCPGHFATTLSTESLKLSTAQNRYVDIATGNNANTGLVAGSPKKSIWHAINVGANDTIYVKGSANPLTPTVYPYDDGWRLPSIANTNVIAVSDFTTLAPGYVVSSIGHVGGDSLLGAWASVGGGTPNTYVATLAAAPYAVLDATVSTANGTPTHLTLQSSIATVNANPGSYWHDSGNLYVRTADSRSPDTSVRALKSAINGHESVAISIYAERITFEGGGSRAFYLQNIVTATFVDCTFRDGQSAGLDLNTVAAAATQTVHLIRCKGIVNAGDGFGATASGAGTTVNWLEWDCEGTGNTSAGGTDQGSSMHFTAGNTAVNAIRVGGYYHANKTQGCADVGGCDTWMLGCLMTGEATGVYIGDTGTAWLHGCVLSGNTTDLVTDNAAGVISTTGGVYNTTSGTGTVNRYHP